jgi:hypothetical protein
MKVIYFFLIFQSISLTDTVNCNQLFATSSKSTEVSEEHVTYIFRVEEYCCMLHAGFLLGAPLNSENEGDIFSRNVC